MGESKIKVTLSYLKKNGAIAVSVDLEQIDPSEIVIFINAPIHYNIVLHYCRTFSNESAFKNIVRFIDGNGKVKLNYEDKFAANKIMKWMKKDLSKVRIKE